MKLPKIDLPHGYFIVPLPDGWKARAPMGELVGYYDTLMECVVASAEHYTRKVLIARGVNEQRDIPLGEAEMVLGDIKDDFFAVLMNGHGPDLTL